MLSGPASLLRFREPLKIRKLTYVCSVGLAPKYLVKSTDLQFEAYVEKHRGSLDEEEPGGTDVVHHWVGRGAEERLCNSHHKSDSSTLNIQGDNVCLSHQHRQPNRRDNAQQHADSDHPFDMSRRLKRAVECRTLELVVEPPRCAQQHGHERQTDTEDVVSWRVATQIGEIGPGETARVHVVNLGDNEGGHEGGHDCAGRSERRRAT